METSINKININDISFDEWQIFTERKGPNANRNIYYNEKSQLFMKIWERNYIWKSNFIRAYKCNYYDNISLLDSIIVDNTGDILGYITKKMQPHNLKLKINQYGNKVLCDNSVTFNFFLNKMKEKVKNLKLVHIDITPSNIGIMDNNIYTFDLEPIVTIDELNNIDYWNKFIPESYVNWIINLD